jgi:hypothetical protein
VLASAGLLVMVPTGAMGALAIIRWADRKRRVSVFGVSEPEIQPEVLMLRDFDDDALREQITPSLSAVGSLSVPLEEELLSWFTLTDRRCVALGCGRPHLESLVAERLEVSDEGWRDEVTHLIERAGVIVVLLGVGDGLTWEVGQIIGLGRLRDTLFILPPAVDNRVQRWDALGKQLRGELTAVHSPARGIVDCLLGRSRRQLTLRGAAELASHRIDGLLFVEERSTFRAFRSDHGPAELVETMLQELDARAEGGERLLLTRAGS